MSEQAVFCKCLNTYSIECKYKKEEECPYFEYWKQGIGSIGTD